MKKLIIVSGIIILASCATVKNNTAPVAEDQNQLILSTLWYQKSAEMIGTRYIVLPNPMYGNWLSELLKMTEGRSEKEKLFKLLETF